MKRRIGRVRVLEGNTQVTLLLTAFIPPVNTGSLIICELYGTNKILTKMYTFSPVLHVSISSS